MCLWQAHTSFAPIDNDRCRRRSCTAVMNGEYGVRMLFTANREPEALYRCVHTRTSRHKAVS